MLRERLGSQRLRFTDAERCRLARRAYALGRKLLSELDTLVTPDTLMRYSAAFRAALTRERIESIQLPPQSPNLNAYAERFVRSVKTECTGRMVFFSRSSLERALMHYVAHYHEERNHQGLQNHLLKCSDSPINLVGRVERRERLGGMLNFYHREAA